MTDGEAADAEAALSDATFLARSPSRLAVLDALDTERVAVGNLGAVTIVLENPTAEPAETTLVLRVDGEPVSGRTDADRRRHADRCRRAR